MYKSGTEVIFTKVADFYKSSNNQRNLWFLLEFNCIINITILAMQVLYMIRLLKVDAF